MTKMTTASSTPIPLAHRARDTACRTTRVKLRLRRSFPRHRLTLAIKTSRSPSKSPIDLLSERTAREGPGGTVERASGTISCMEAIMRSVLLAAILLVVASTARAGQVDRLYVIDCGWTHAADQSRWSPGVNVGVPIDLG